MTAWNRIFGCCSDDTAEVMVAESTISESGGNKLLASLLVNVWQWFQLVLWKFHHITGLLRTGKAGLGGTISEGQCCNLGNFSKMRLSGTLLSGPTLTDVRSGLMPVFQQPE